MAEQRSYRTAKSMGETREVLSQMLTFSPSAEIAETLIQQDSIRCSKTEGQRWRELGHEKKQQNMQDNKRRLPAFTGTRGTVAQASTWASTRSAVAR